MWYSILKNNNGFNISNRGIKPITLKVYNGDSKILEKEIDLENTCSISIPQQEGLYKVEIFTEDNKIEYILPNFPDLFKDLIESIKKALNVQTCSTCIKVDTSKDSKESCEILLNTLMKCIYYYTLVGKYYNKYFNTFSNSIEDSLSKDYSCNKNIQKILGKSSDTTMVKKFISMFYMTFFYGEKEFSFGSKVNQTYQEILDKFEFNNISPYLVGITPVFLENLCKEKEGIFTIGDLKKDFIIQKEPYTFTQKDFLTLTKPNYFSNNLADIKEIKIGKFTQNFEAEFIYKDELLEEGLTIPFEDIGKGFLKFYFPSKEYHCDSKSYFTFAIKTTTSNRYSNLSTCKINVKWQE